MINGLLHKVIKNRFEIFILLVGTFILCGFLSRFNSNKETITEDRALALFDSAETVAMQYGFLYTAPLFKQAVEKLKKFDTPIPSIRCLIFEAQRYSNKAEFDKAQESLDKALVMCKAHLGEFHSETANTLLFMGQNLNNQMDPGSINYYKESIRIIEHLKESDNLSLAKNHMGLACAYSYLSQHHKMLIHYKQAAELVKSKDDAWFLLSKIYLKMGSVYLVKNNPDKAMTYFQYAFSLHRSHSDTTSINFGRLLNYIGIIHSDRGHYQKGFQYYMKALHVYLHTATGDANLVKIYNDLGCICMEIGDHEKAINFFNNALKLKEISRYNPSRMASMVSLGDIHFQKCDYNRALFFYNNALQLWQQHYKGYHPGMIHIYSKIARCTYKEKNIKKAIEYINKAISDSRQLFSQNHPIFLKFMAELALFKQAAGQSEEAFQIIDQADSIVYKIHSTNYPLLAEMHHMKGVIYENGKKWDQAESEYIKALTHLNHRDDEEINVRSDQFLFSVYVLLANLYEKQQTPRGFSIEDIKLCLNYLDLSIQQSRRIRFVQDIDMSGFEEIPDLISIYEKAIELAVNLYEITGDISYLEKAFSYSESNKAGNLLKKVFESSFVHNSEKESPLIIQLNEIESEIQKLNKNIWDAYGRGAEKDSAKIDRWQKNIWNLEYEYTNLKEKLETKQPVIARLLEENRNGHAMAICKEVLSSDEAMISYFLGKEKGYIFVLRQEGIEYCLAPVSIDNLKQDLENYRSGLCERDYDQYTKYAFACYQNLIDPVIHLIQDKHLIIVPDDQLSALPFEAFITEMPEGKTENYKNLSYLINSFQINYQYSAALYIEYKNMPIKNKEPFTVLAMAPGYAD